MCAPSPPIRREGVPRVPRQAVAGPSRAHLFGNCKDILDIVVRKLADCKDILTMKAAPATDAPSIALPLINQLCPTIHHLPPFTRG